jgi:hypothetical protein
VVGLGRVVAKGVGVGKVRAPGEVGMGFAKMGCVGLREQQVAEEEQVSL